MSRIEWDHVILVLAVAVLVLFGYLAGSMLDTQREVIERLDLRAEAREVEIADLKADIDRLKDDIREEIRRPAGDRAETHEAARRAEAGLQEALRLLQELCEATEGCEP